MKSYDKEHKIKTAESMKSYDKDHKIKTAERLKELRKNQKLSLADLSYNLEEQGIMTISEDALRIYEISNPNPGKFKKGSGMSIKYLHGLARFYEVSTDYLLGNTDIKSPDTHMGDICEYLSLSEDAVYALRALKDDPDNIYDPSFICFILDKMLTSGFIAKCIDVIVGQVRLQTVASVINEYNNIVAETTNIQTDYYTWTLNNILTKHTKDLINQHIIDAPEIKEIIKESLGEALGDAKQNEFNAGIELINFLIEHFPIIDE